MAYYVFLVSDQGKYGKQRTAEETFDILVKGKSAWGFGPQTPNRKAIGPGDKVVFYMTGPDRQWFVAAASLRTTAYRDGSGESKDWYLDPETLRIDLEDITIFSEPKPRKDIPSLEWRPAQGGSAKITEKDYVAILGNLYSQPHPHATADLIEFALENHLEDFIVENWPRLFDKGLTVFEDENGNTGKQYFTDIGYIDILAQDSNRGFVVIELKKGKSGDEVVGQTLRYMAWVREHLASGQDVRAIIITQKSDRKLRYALREVKSKITLKHYSVDFKLTDATVE